MKLYTIPYAGGFAFTYFKWKKYLDAGIELCPIELPGRGTKAKENLCASIEAMAEQAYKQINVSSEEYILFGHSMGGYVLLELYKKLQANNRPLPQQVVLSAMKPPHLYIHKQHHLLDEETFKGKMMDLGGLPEEVMQDQEFSAYILRLLRNDFKAVEEYKKRIESIFSSDVHLFNSEADISRDDMEEWNRYTYSNTYYHSFEGSHFFINEHPADVVETINQLVEEKLYVHF